MRRSAGPAVLALLALPPVLALGACQDKASPVPVPRDSPSEGPAAVPFPLEALIARGPALMGDFAAITLDAPLATQPTALFPPTALAPLADGRVAVVAKHPDASAVVNLVDHRVARVGILVSGGGLAARFEAAWATRFPRSEPDEREGTAWFNPERGIRLTVKEVTDYKQRPASLLYVTSYSPTAAVLGTTGAAWETTPVLGARREDLAAQASPGRRLEGDTLRLPPSECGFVPGAEPAPLRVQLVFDPQDRVIATELALPGCALAPRDAVKATLDASLGASAPGGGGWCYSSGVCLVAAREIDGWLVRRTAK